MILLPQIIREETKEEFLKSGQDMNIPPGKSVCSVKSMPG